MEGRTGNIWAGAVVSPVLQESVFTAHLLWFWVGIPSGLRPLLRAVLHRVVVQLKAFALWSQLPILVPASIRSCVGINANILEVKLEKEDRNGNVGL